MKTALSLDQFRGAFLAGGLRPISVMASGGQFFVTAQQRKGDRLTLATTHGKRLRTFRNPAKAIEILYEMGAHRVEVDTSAWSPTEAQPEGKKRPDTAERQRRIHQAAAHDAWFRQGVEMAVREADGPDAEWNSQEQVKRQSAVHRAAWLSNSSNSEKASF